MKPKIFKLSIVCLFIAASFLTCKKTTVYPKGTVTIKYVATWTGTLAATNTNGQNGGVNSVAYLDGSSNGVVEPISGNSWTKTVVMTYKPGDFVHPFLILEIGLLQQGSSTAKIYGNDVLKVQATYSTGDTKFNNLYNANNQVQYVVDTTN